MFGRRISTLLCTSLAAVVVWTVTGSTCVQNPRRNPLQDITDSITPPENESFMPERPRAIFPYSAAQCRRIFNAYHDFVGEADPETAMQALNDLYNQDPFEALAFASQIYTMRATGLLETAQAISWITQIFEEIGYCDLFPGVDCASWTNQDEDVGLKTPSFPSFDGPAISDYGKSINYMWAKYDDQHNPIVDISLRIHRRNFADPKQEIDEFIISLQALGLEHQILKYEEVTINTGQFGFFTDMQYENYDGSHTRWAQIAVLENGRAYNLSATATPNAFNMYRPLISPTFDCFCIADEDGDGNESLGDLTPPSETDPYVDEIHTSVNQANAMKILGTPDGDYFHMNYGVPAVTGIFRDNIPRNGPGADIKIFTGAVIEEMDFLVVARNRTESTGEVITLTAGSQHVYIDLVDLDGPFEDLEIQMENIAPFGNPGIDIDAIKALHNEGD